MTASRGKNAAAARAAGGSGRGRGALKALGFAALALGNAVLLAHTADVYHAVVPPMAGFAVSVLTMLADVAVIGWRGRRRQEAAARSRQGSSAAIGGGQRGTCARLGRRRRRRQSPGYVSYRRWNR